MKGIGNLGHGDGMRISAAANLASEGWLGGMMETLS